MRSRDVFTLCAVAAVVFAGRARAQDSLQAARQQVELRLMIERIAHERPPQAEIGAREIIRRMSLEQVMLDSLRLHARDQYWQEVAQLMVQREMVRQQTDSLRAQLMLRVFAEEARARMLQRQYVERMEVDRVRDSIRTRLQEVLRRRFVAEDSLRQLEIAEVRQRLQQVQAEAERRRRDREIIVKQMVEEVLGKP